MKTMIKINQVAACLFIASVLMVISSCQKENSNEPAGSSAANSVSALERNPNSLVFPSTASMYGSSYSVWTAKWWKWAMEQPMAGHPFTDDVSFNVNTGQTGDVWFLASPFGTVVRHVTIPTDKALLVAVFNSEGSDLEGFGTTLADQTAGAKWQTDHIIASSLFCTIDNMAINNISSYYRFVSPQFSFTAPSPWVFGTTGGAGTAVGDGYFLMIKPLEIGTHTIHYGGDVLFTLANDGFDFAGSIDMTYHVTVQ